MKSLRFLASLALVLCVSQIEAKPTPKAKPSLMKRLRAWVSPKSNAAPAALPVEPVQPKALKATPSASRPLPKSGTGQSFPSRYDVNNTQLK